MRKKFLMDVYRQDTLKNPQTAIIGNLYQEAGQDSNGDINLHATESTGEGVGMVQWSFGRKTAFLQFL